MKTDLLRLINEKRSKELPEWTDEPTVKFEDTQKYIFDIKDTKNVPGTIFCQEKQGDATYYNKKPYNLRFIKNEEFFNQFKVQDVNGRKNDWTRGLSSPDYVVYNLESTKSYFIIHELSTGNIQNKRPKAMIQLLNMVRFLWQSEPAKQFISQFSHKLCIMSASGCIEISPHGIADGFMEIYKKIPDPIPSHNKSIEKRGFNVIETKSIKLE